MIYLDNNATTSMSPEVLKAMLKWSNRGNASASYASARESRQMMLSFARYIGKLCKVSICEGNPREGDPHMGPVSGGEGTAVDRPRGEWCVFFVANASEANAFIITSTVDSCTDWGTLSLGTSPPHLVVSAVEHKSVLLTVENLSARGRCTVTYVSPDVSGGISPADIEAAIRHNTCLVVCMHANNETGTINDVHAIGKVAHKHGVPFYTDTVQTFGKFPLNPGDSIDGFNCSFHKLGGPPGVGVLILRRKFLNGYGLRPLIPGSQNEGMRGGTENLPGIGASFVALRLAMENRAEKNRKLAVMAGIFVSELSARIPLRSYRDYLLARAKSEIEIILISPIPLGTGNAPRQSTLPNTILLSVVKHAGERICNGKLKQSLERQGIIVSIGSACNTSSSKASHVLRAMKADAAIRAGTLRISFGDRNTPEDAKKAAMGLIAAINEQM